MLDNQNKLERNLHSIVTGLATIALCWVAATTTSANTKIEVLTVKVEAMQKLMDIQTIDRYRAADADKDFQLRDAKIQRNIERIENIERKLKM